VLAVHGFEGTAAKDCGEFAALAARLPGRLRTVGYYTGDIHADVMLPGHPATTNTSIDELGERLAGLIQDRYAGRPVDLVGHSMGGLIAQAALAHLPPAAVRRIVMLGTPFAGLPSAVGCGATQCLELVPGSDYLARAAERGFRADLCVGSEADEAVPISSALAASCAESLRVPAAAGVHHGDLITSPVVLSRVVEALT
jgi:pimeloyl-ACP methyl ester carboxylesterase